ncbi:MAG: transcriptional regulator [Gammaproteobacteria bacterium]|nr:transcriptional regulator [Gammaproteobacteria bacterium]MDH5513541.1 transcriptional regulator [Gammaproteobacteria bacterium]
MNAVTREMNAASDGDFGNADNAQRLKRLRALIAGGPRTLMMYMTVIAILYAGWSRRGDVYLSPEEGLGYALGITGGLMMLSLLLYPLRKHKKWARILGGVRNWFRMHMVLGVIGPVCILYHCNFQLGSMNGNVALFSMLLVASSGLIGRYFYGRVHYGLHGSKADLENLGSDAAALRGCMKYIFEESPSMQKRLDGLDAKTRNLPDGFVASFIHVIYISMLTRWARLATARDLRLAINAIHAKNRMDRQTLGSLDEVSRFYLKTYLEAIKRVAGFSFYERLFSLWHLLHMPLFMMLLVTGTIHVLAVHMY